MARILLAESEPAIRRLLKEELQDDGYEVLGVARGGEVVRLVETFNPDLVLMEVVLSDMSGLEVGRMVKGTKRGIHIVYFSHCLPPRDLSPWGGDAFVVKSPNLERLKEVVHRLAPA
jgi:DNA-binding response OmpR family regulator